MILLADSNTRILDPVSELDYFDTQTAELPRDVTPLEVWNFMTGAPQPVLKLAFRIRDAISSLFGVKSIKGFSGKPVQSAEVGDWLDFFLVEYIDAQSLVLTERDRHLDVMTCISINERRVAVTSSVRVHNRFGRAYMLPVGIAHKWIVRNMLRRLQRSLLA